MTALATVTSARTRSRVNRRLRRRRRVRAVRAGRHRAVRAVRAQGRRHVRARAARRLGARAEHPGARGPAGLHPRRHLDPARRPARHDRGVHRAVKRLSIGAVLLFFIISLLCWADTGSWANGIPVNVVSLLQGTLAASIPLILGALAGCDEFVEVTPKSLRLRKKILQANKRKRSSMAMAEEER